MHPAAAVPVQAAGGAVPVQAAGGAVKVRAVARANIILGLAMAAMAIVAATTSPADFHGPPQVTEQAAPAPGAQGCAETEADALDLREAALELVLIGVVQTVLATAADVAVAGSLLKLGRCLAAVAHLIGVLGGSVLCYVVKQVSVLAMGHCAGQYLGALDAGYTFVSVSYAVLLGVSFAVIFCC